MAGGILASNANPSDSLARIANTLASSPSLDKDSSVPLSRVSPALAEGVKSSCPSGSYKGLGIPLGAVLSLFSISFSTFIDEFLGLLPAIHSTYICLVKDLLNLMVTQHNWNSFVKHTLSHK